MKDESKFSSLQEYRATIALSDKDLNELDELTLQNQEASIKSANWILFEVKKVFNFNLSFIGIKTLTRSLIAISKISLSNFFLPYNCDLISEVIGQIEAKM